MAEPVSAAGTTARPWWDLTPRDAHRIALILLFLITLPMLTKIFTSDYGTHIAQGRQIIETRSLPDREYLNYPSLGRYNPNGEWGFQAILYLVHSLGGVYAVSFLCWALVFGIFLLLHRATVLRGANPFLAVLAIFAFSGFLRIRIQPRPEIFTYFFIAVTICILSEYYYGRRKRLIYLFPPLVLIWANCHPTYLMGLVLCGVFFFDALLRQAWNREFRWPLLKGWIIPPILVGIAGLAVCGLNPHGYDALLLPLHLISRGGGGTGGGGGGVLMSISELTPVKGTGFFVYYKAAAAFAAVSLILGLAGRRVYLLDLLLFAIAFKGAWDSARAVSMMGLFLSPGASLHLTGFFLKTGEWFGAKKDIVPPRDDDRKGRGKEKGRKGGGKEPRAAAAPAGPNRSWAGGVIGAALVLCILVFGGTTLAFSFSQLEYGVGITEHKFSFKAAEFLRANPVPGKMFNFFDIGGFLDWQLFPQALTFIDGRTYNAEVFMDHQMVTGAMPGWQNVLRKYEVTYCVLKAMDSSGMILPIVPALTNDPGWSLVFADGLFVVFVRDVPELREYVLRHQLPKAYIMRHIIQEAYHYTFLGVSPIVAYSTMANMYLSIGDTAGAIGALRQGISQQDDPYLRERLMQLERSGSPGPRRP